MTFERIIVVATLLSMISCVLGAVPILDGSDAKFWESHAVVIGKVDSPVSDASGDRFHVHLLGVVATDFVVPVELSIRYTPGPESALTNVVDGSTVLLCLKRDKDGWTLPTSGIAFFPSGNAIAVVSGMSDPALEKTSQQVKKLRSERTR